MTSTSSTVPLFIMEEHHEAFFVWHYAIQAGLMAPTGNKLLHVDEHADIGAPRLFQSVDELGSDLDAIHRFAFNELSCFEFIVPSLYQGLFDELVWLRQAPERKSDQLLIVRTPRRAGQLFDLVAYNLVNGKRALPPSAPADGHQVRYLHQAEADPLPALNKVVLDIDLDYFSCEDAVNQAQRLEVTQAEFEAFQTNRYHFLRISQGSRIKMREEGGRFFLYLKNYQEAAPTPLRVSEETIVARLDRFAEFLARNHIQPQIIDIARSRFSGYTPSDQWAFIERQLLERLAALYPLEIRSVDEVHHGLARPTRPGTAEVRG